MMRWITAFIDENQEEWESEKGLISHENLKEIQECEKADLEACMPAKKQFSGKRKVSDFPIPEKPVKMRGAELAKSKFLRKMDKAYFSIMNLRDIKEETEYVEATMPSVRVCQPASKVAVERRAGWLCQPVSWTDDGAAVIRDLEASMPKMLSDINVGVHDAISYAEVPPTIVKINVKLTCLADDAEMSLSVENMQNVKIQVRPDAAETSLSVEKIVKKKSEMGRSLSLEKSVHEFVGIGPDATEICMSVEVPSQDVRMCQPASKVAVVRRAGWLCQPGSRTDDGDAVTRNLEASMPKMLSKVKVTCLEDIAEMSPSVETMQNEKTQVRPDAAETSLSVEKIVKEAEMGQSLSLERNVHEFVQVRQDATEMSRSVELPSPESGPPTPAQENPKIHPQSMPPSVENSCCYRSNSDWPNRPVGGDLRYPCTSVHGGTTLCNMGPCSRLKKQ